MQELVVAGHRFAQVLAQQALQGAVLAQAARGLVQALAQWLGHGF
ncbi:hypothetical protein [Inhella sp.]